MFTRAQFVTQVMKTWPTSNDQDLSPCFLLRTDGDGRTETRADRTRRDEAGRRARTRRLAGNTLAGAATSLAKGGEGKPGCRPYQVCTQNLPKMEDERSHNLPKMEDEPSVDGCNKAQVLADHRRAEEVGSARIGASA